MLPRRVVSAAQPRLLAAQLAPRALPALRATSLQARAGPSLSRSLSTTPLLLRRGDDDDRVPRGHVRPQRPRRQQIPYGYDQHQQQNPYQQQQQQPPQSPFNAFGGFSDGPDPSAYSHTQSPYARAVSVPSDPGAVLADTHAARELLAQDALIIVRQFEMLNVFMGYEQANRYAIHAPSGELVGFLAEEDNSIFKTMQRQLMHTHRPFRATIMDPSGRPILWVRRPFNIINSRIMVHASDESGVAGAKNDGGLVGEAMQQWHPWRRRYNLFESRADIHQPDGEPVMSQFGRVDAGFLAWDFWIKDRDDRLIATINRNFRGLGRELFTDTGQYVVRFDAAGTELDLPPGSQISVQGQKIVLPDSGSRGLTLDQRAMTLATAVSIDFDYFSRHSGSGGFGFPFLWWGGGGDGDMGAQREGGDPSTAGTAAGAGAANAPYPQDMTDDEIYGRTSGAGQQSGGGGGGAPGANEPPVPGQQAEGFDYPYPGQQEDVMQDPWEQRGGDGEGLFGGGSDGGGGDGGGWGDWGDWS